MTYWTIDSPWRFWQEEAALDFETECRPTHRSVYRPFLIEFKLARRLQYTRHFSTRLHRVPTIHFLRPTHPRFVHSALSASFPLSISHAVHPLRPPPLFLSVLLSPFSFFLSSFLLFSFFFSSFFYPRTTTTSIRLLPLPVGCAARSLPRTVVARGSGIVSRYPRVPRPLARRNKGPTMGPRRDLNRIFFSLCVTVFQQLFYFVSLLLPPFSVSVDGSFPTGAAHSLSAFLSLSHSLFWSYGSHSVRWDTPRIQRDISAVGSRCTLSLFLFFPLVIESPTEQKGYCFLCVCVCVCVFLSCLAAFRSFVCSFVRTPTY